MSQDELQAAAERKRFRNAGEHVLSDCYATGTTNSQRDNAILATAWLAEHPADDGRMADDSWRDAVGFVSAENDYWSWVKSPDGRIALAVNRDGAWQICNPEKDYDTVDLDPNRMATRGAVRLVCAALGIPLKETA